MRPTNCAWGTIFVSDEMIRQYQATFRANGQKSLGSFLEEKELKAWQKTQSRVSNPLNQWNGLKWIESVNQSVLVRFKMNFWGVGAGEKLQPLFWRIWAWPQWSLRHLFATWSNPETVTHCGKMSFFFGSQKSKSFLKVIDQLSFSLEDPKKTALGSTFAWPGLWDNMQDGKFRKQSLFEMWSVPEDVM